MLAQNYACFSCRAVPGQFCTELCPNMSRKFGKLGSPKPEEFKTPVISSYARKYLLNRSYGKFGAK